MVTRWEQGRATLEKLIHDGQLARVPANAALATHYLVQAERHLLSSRTLASKDPVGAFGLAYDVARLSLAITAYCSRLESQRRGLMQV